MLGFKLNHVISNVNQLWIFCGVLSRAHALNLELRREWVNESYSVHALHQMLI